MTIRCSYFFALNNAKRKVSIQFTNYKKFYNFPQINALNFIKKKYLNLEEKNLNFFSLCPLIPGGELKALAGMSAKNVHFFWTAPLTSMFNDFNFDYQSGV